jgi:uroporphyrinogen decarboxylase
MFREFSLRYLAQIAQSLKVDNVASRVPLVLFSKGANGHLEALADTGCAALGLDWTIALGDARTRVGDRVALQGNVDPAVLHAAPETIRAEVKKALDSFGAHPGHVFNLGHGITPDVNPEHLAVLVNAVHELSAR